MLEEDNARRGKHNVNHDSKNYPDKKTDLPNIEFRFLLKICVRCIFYCLNHIKLLTQFCLIMFCRVATHDQCTNNDVGLENSDFASH